MVHSLCKKICTYPRQSRNEKKPHFLKSVDIKGSSHYEPQDKFRLFDLDL